MLALVLEPPKSLSISESLHADQCCLETDQDSKLGKESISILQRGSPTSMNASAFGQTNQRANIDHEPRTDDIAEMTLAMSSSEIFGFAAATLSTIAFLPQVIKTWRSQSAKDVSYALLLTFSTGCLCWVIYGYQVNAKPVMIANSFTLALNLTILAMKFVFERNINVSPEQIQQ